MSAARVFVLPPRQRPLLKNFCNRSLRSDSQISVAFGDDLTVLADLNGVAIENGYAEAVTAKFHRAVRRRDPAFKCGLSWVIINSHPHISFLQWFNIDASRSVNVCCCVFSPGSSEFVGAHR